MPSIAAHMVMAKLVSTALNLKSPDFIKGNLVPDIISNSDSHHKIKGKYFDIPNISYFKNTLDLNSELFLGYYVHLLLDKYYLEEFVPNNIKNLLVFENKIVYDEYNSVNYELVKHFSLDIPYLVSILNDYPVPIDKTKLTNNISYLTNTYSKETVYLKVPDFITFLNNTSKIIIEEVREYAH